VGRVTALPEANSTQTKEITAENELFGGYQFFAEQELRVLIPT
jgi:hypothetical protein